MRNQFAERMRTPSVSLSSVPPSPTSKEYSINLANLAIHILYRSPLPSQNDLPVFVLNAAAFPDAKEVDYDALLPYVLARLPDEDELITGHGYEIVFFAGTKGNGAASAKKGRPGWGWFLQAYHLLTRLTRKRLQKLYIVHEKNWIRLLVGMFSTVVSPKFNKKVVHVSSISALAMMIPIEDLLIPPSAYLTDRSFCSEIYAPYMSGRRAFAVKQALPICSTGGTRLPRVLREPTSFLITDPLIKTEGIFRINPRAVEVEILKEAYDRAQKFIVWREGVTYQASPHWQVGLGEVWVDELEHAEGFGVYSAAGLIKQWYKDLRNPIFPQESYTALEKFYGDSDRPFQVQHMLEMLSQNTTWSILSKTSRKILTTHLLPMLSRVADFQDWNQMTPYNLALCFAPIMLCGPDPIQDYKISGILRRLLEAMINHWHGDLAPMLDMDNWKFEEFLRLPENLDDREDSLEESQAARPSTDVQDRGILLLNNDEDSGEEVETKPPLPPRPQQLANETGLHGDSSTFRRRPAPPLQTPPRYSTLMGSAHPASGDRDISNVPSKEDIDDHDGTDESSDLPAYHPMSPPPSSPPPVIPRKPLPKADSGI